MGFNNDARRFVDQIVAAYSLGVVDALAAPVRSDVTYWNAIDGV